MIENIEHSEMVFIDKSNKQWNDGIVHLYIMLTAL